MTSLNTSVNNRSQHRYGVSQLESPAQILDLKSFNIIRNNNLLGKIVATSGGFDPIHYGHGRSLLEAKKLGDTLVVIVNGDTYLRHKKGQPFQDLRTRCLTLSYLKGVDYVIPYEVKDDLTVIQALKVVRPHIFAKGGDRSTPEAIPEMAILKEIGAEMVFGVGGTAKDVSSTEILAKYRASLTR